MFPCGDISSPLHNHCHYFSVCASRDSRCELIPFRRPYMVLADSARYQAGQGGHGWPLDAAIAGGLVLTLTMCKGLPLHWVTRSTRAKSNKN